MKYLTNFFRNRTKSFWVALGAAILSITASFVYIGGIFSSDRVREFVNVYPFILLLAGGILFFIAALFRYSKLGAIINGIFDLFAIVIFLGYFVAYPVSTAVANDGGSVVSLPGFDKAIAVVIMTLIAVVALNVCAWRPLEKTDEVKQ